MNITSKGEGAKMTTLYYNLFTADGTLIGRWDTEAQARKDARQLGIENTSTIEKVEVSK